MAPGCAPAADTSGVGGGCEAESGTSPGRVLQPACTICLDPPAAGGAATTACGHSFCVGCILEWVERKPTCPCCKAGPIESLSLHRQLDGTSVAEARTEPVVLLLRAKWRVRPQLAGPEEPELEPEPEPEPEVLTTAEEALLAEQTVRLQDRAAYLALAIGDKGRQSLGKSLLPGLGEPGRTRKEVVGEKKPLAGILRAFGVDPAPFLGVVLRQSLE